MAAVVVVLEAVIAFTFSNFVAHLCRSGTDGSAFDFDLGLARTWDNCDVANGRIRVGAISLHLPSMVTHIGHLAATEDRAEDGWANQSTINNGVRNDDRGVFGSGEQQGRSSRMPSKVDTLHGTLTATKHIAHGIGLESLNQSFVTDGAAVHLHVGVAVVVACQHVGIGVSFPGRCIAAEAAARQGETATTEDTAVDGATTHQHRVIALHTTGCVVLPVVVTATAEDVAVVACGTRRTHKATDVLHLCIAQNVAVLGAAEHATPQTVGNAILVRFRIEHIHDDLCVVDIGKVIILTVRMRG